ATGADRKRARRSQSARRNRNPGLRARRRDRVVGAGALAVVPVLLRPRLLLNVDGGLGLDVDRRVVVVLRIIPPVRICVERHEADEDRAAVMEMMMTAMVTTGEATATSVATAALAAAGVGRRHHHQRNEDRESDAHQMLLHLDS